MLSFVTQMITDEEHKQSPALEVRSVNCPDIVSRQTLTDCILKNKEKKSKATPPNPFAYSFIE